MIRRSLTLFLVCAIATIAYWYFRSSASSGSKEAELRYGPQGTEGQIDSSNLDAPADITLADPPSPLIAQAELNRSASNTILANSPNRLLLKVNGDGGEIVSADLIAVVLDDRARGLLSKSHLDRSHVDALTRLAATSNIAGSWELSWPSSNDSVGLILTAEGYRAQGIVLTGTDFFEAQSRTIILERAQPLHVRVQDRSGAPIGDATVHLRSDDLGLSDGVDVETLFGSRWYWFVVRTESDGGALLLSPPEGLLSVFVEPTGQYASEMVWSQDSTREITICCSGAYSITGIVASREGAPIFGVGLTVVSTDGRWSEQPLQMASSGRDGRFVFEALPADNEIHYVIVHDDRYVFTRSDPIVPREFGVVSIALNTARALAMEVRVSTLDNRPIANAECFLFCATSGRVPMVFVTNNEGILRIPGYMAAGEICTIHVNLSGCEVVSEAFVVPASPRAPINVEVPGIGRIVAVHDSAGESYPPDTELNVYPLVDAEGYCSTFIVGSLPQDVPSGQSTLIMADNSGMHRSVEINVAEGLDTVLMLGDSKAPLSFRVDQSQATEVRILTPQRYLVAQPRPEQGLVECFVTPGSYIIAVARGEHTEEIGPVWITERGLELGLLDSGASSTISGGVYGQNGDPIAGVPIVAYGILGFRSDYSFTDASGNFILQDLPAGAYTVDCSTGKILGGQSPSMRIPVLLGCNANVEGINFDYSGAHTRVEFMHDAKRGAVGAFIIEEQKLQIVHGAQSKVFFVPAIASSVIAGFWERNTKSLDLHIQELAPGAHSYIVGRQSLSNFSLMSNNRGVRVRLKEFSLPVEVPSTGEPDVLLRTNMPEVINAWLEDSDGDYAWRKLTDLVNKLQMQEFKLRIINANGQPIQGATVIGRNSESRAISDSAGVVNLKLTENDWVWTDHSLYWALQQRLVANYTEVTLRHSFPTSSIPFKSLPRAERLHLHPSFDLGYEFHSPRSSLTAGRDGWQLPLLPIGDYVATLIMSDGTEQSQRVILNSDGSTSVY